MNDTERMRKADGERRSVMSGSLPISEIVRLLVKDPEYVKALTRRIEARTEDREIVERLIAYARARQATQGHAIARKILTDAGVSWEPG